MTTSWPVARLSDLAELSGGFAFKSQDYSPSGRFVLRTLNIRDDGSICRDDAVYLPEDLWPQFSRFELQPQDTLFVMVGATLGKVGFVQSKDLPALLNQNMWRIRAKKDVVDPRYIHYAFRFVVKASLALASGSARDFVRRDYYRNLQIPSPPLKEQQLIGNILGTLDEKIELNRDMNQTLEATARTIFQSWFVAFDPVRTKAEGRHPFGMDSETAGLFPDGFEESEMGKIPKGWKVKALDEIATFLNGLALQKYPPSGNDFLPVIKIADMRRGNTEQSDRASIEIPEEYIVHDGDVLFSWSGSLEVMFWCGGNGALNQHLFKVRSADYPKWFYFQWVLHHLSEFQAIAAGKATTMGHIQRHHLSDAKVVVPPALLLEKMNVSIAPLIDAQIRNNLESRTLISLRDVLLPQLISGEMPFPCLTKA